MSSKTRERIQNVIALSNYQPSPIAQSLKSRRTMQIGVVIADISSPFSSAMLQGIGRVLDKAGYIPLIVNSGEDLSSEEKLIAKLIGRGVDGLLVNTAGYDNPYLIEVSNRGMPVVLCDRYVRDFKFDIVSNEVNATTRRLISHLKEQGFSVPTMFTESYEQNSARLFRREAFLRFIMEIYGVQDAQQHVVVADVGDLHKTSKQIQTLMRAANPGEIPVIVAVNTVTTMHVLSAIKHLGYSIPGQIGVCGADDWNWDKRIEWPTLIDPSITTYAINADMLGESAAKLLMKRIENSSLPKEEKILPVQFVARGSTSLRAR